MNQESALRARALDASERAIAAMSAAGTSEMPIRDLAAAAGVSERTFYRYFPRKEDVLRPILDQASGIITAALRRHVDEGLVEASVAAFREAAVGDYLERTRQLLPLVESDPALRVVWVQVTHEPSPARVEVCAQQLNLPPSDARARLVATIIVVIANLSLREAVEHGGDPVALFAENMRSVEHGLFVPEPRDP